MLLLSKDVRKPQRMRRLSACTLQFLSLLSPPALLQPSINLETHVGGVPKNVPG